MNLSSFYLSFHETHHLLIYPNLDLNPFIETLTVPLTHETIIFLFTHLDLNLETQNLVKPSGALILCHITTLPKNLKLMGHKTAMYVKRS